MKIGDIAIGCETTNQFHPIGFGVLVKVFFETEVTSGAEDERKGMTWGGVDPNKPDDVRMRKLGVHPYLLEVSLEMEC